MVKDLIRGFSQRDLDSMGSLFKSINDSVVAFNSIQPVLKSELFNASVISQAIRAQEDLSRMNRMMAPTLKAIQDFNKINSGMFESIRQAMELSSVYAAQINAINSIIKISVPSFDVAKVIRERQDFVHSCLDDELQKIGPQYHLMWRGSWMALESDNPDKVRQSAHSMRELFTRLIHEFSDDGAIIQQNAIKKGDKITRAQRLAFILKKTGLDNDEVQQIDQMIKDAVAITDTVIKNAHVSGDADNLRELLYLYEGYILTIIEEGKVSVNRSAQ